MSNPPNTTANAALDTTPFDLLILDISLPKLCGFEVLKRLRARNSRLPVLVKRGYPGPVYGLPATRLLSQHLLLDGAKLQMEDAERSRRHGAAPEPPLFDEEDVHATIERMRPVAYGEALDVAGMRVTHAGFAAMARRLRRAAEASAGGRLVAVLEGGYDLDGLSGGMTAVLRELTAPSVAADPIAPLPPENRLQRAAIEGTLAAHAKAGLAIPEPTP